MFCTNCGREIKDENFCPNCGNSIYGGIPAATPVNYNKNSKKALTIILIVFGILMIGIICLALLILFILFALLNKVETYSYIRMPSYEIPSVYGVLGDKKGICSYNTSYNVNEMHVEIDYCNHLSDSDIKKYIDYLTEKEGFVSVEGVYGFSCERVDKKYKYVITIDSGDKIIYSSEKSEFTDNTVRDSKDSV